MPYLPAQLPRQSFELALSSANKSLIVTAAQIALPEFSCSIVTQPNAIVEIIVTAQPSQGTVGTNGYLNLWFYFDGALVMTGPVSVGNRYANQTNPYEASGVIHYCSPVLLKAGKRTIALNYTSYNAMGQAPIYSFNTIGSPETNFLTMWVFEWPIPEYSWR